jgi:ribonuclease P protein component
VEGRPRVRGTASFGPERRIRKHADFQRVQKAGRAVRTPHFVLVLDARTPPVGPARLGIVATKKLGSAPRRNRIKRLCRECFRLDRTWFPDGIDCVAIAKSGTHELSLADVTREWDRVRGQIRRTCEEALERAKKAASSVEMGGEAKHVPAGRRS